MQHYRVDALPATPWRNGRGTTREIARWPAAAGDDAFDWRLSLATIAGDAPFSRFPGIDRVMVLLAGPPIAITLGDATPAWLRAPGDALRFHGERDVEVRHSGASTTVLNVMTRRGRFVADVNVASDALEVRGASGLVHACAGTWRGDGHVGRLGAGEGAWWGDGCAPGILAPDGTGACLTVVTLRAVRGHRSW